MSRCTPTIATVLKLSQTNEAVKTHGCIPVSANYGIIVDTQFERFRCNDWKPRCKQPPRLLMNRRME